MSNRILTYKDSDDLLILKSPSLSVDLDKDSWKSWTEALFATTVQTACLGLALPQLGLNKRMIAIKKRETKEILIMINPKIVDKSLRVMPYREGCLSIPGLKVMTNRPKDIKVDFINIRGELIENYAASGEEAICIQHEIDHLDGILMTAHGQPFRSK